MPGRDAVTVFAPAKINLYLHVTGRRDDGYHLLDSLVAFADIGDTVKAGPAENLSLTVRGPEAAGLQQLGEGNLVLRAARSLAAHYGIAPKAALTLDKQLPIASGIGGGSSDAAAALRALAGLWQRPIDDVGAIALELGADVPACLAGRPVWVGGVGERLHPAPPLPPLGIVPRAALTLDKHLPIASGIGGGSSDAAATLHALAGLWRCPIDDVGAIALELGADVPACLAGRPVWVGGVGERLHPAPPLPPLGIVLANPRRELPTADVFRARRGGFSQEAPRIDVSAPDALFALLSRCRNDLTEAAVSLMPEIAVVLDRLARFPGARLTRMSGSGATCFALFADREAASHAAAVFAEAEPGWWVRAGTLLSS